MVNAQEWLKSQEQYNTKEKREKITKLNISQKGLEGSLNLTSFVNLTKLWCYGNELTTLDLTGLTELETILCYSNYLTKFDYSSLNADKLTWLYLTDNNLPEQDCSVFSRFINLVGLSIDNYDKDKISQGIYNRFVGSLEPLQNLTKLKNLNISNTDINSGLEYLPNGLEKIHCSNEERLESKVSKISEQLSLYNHDIKKWKENWKWDKLDSKIQEKLIEAGVKQEEYKFIDYLKQKEYKLANISEEELIKEYKEYHQVKIWLDFNYPKEKRKDIRVLDLTNLELEGDLNLKDFTDLKRAYLIGNPRLGEIKIKNKGEDGVKIYAEAEVQEWLNRKYPNKKKVKKINLKNKWKGGPEIEEGISGELIVDDFPQLKEIVVYYSKLIKLQINNCPKLTELKCQYNELTELIITDCPNLKIIDASGNQLTNLDLSNNQQLEHLNIESNKFSQDLSHSLIGLKYLVNLRWLLLRHNRFTGSLKPLRNLNKLEKLNISDTNISHGLEYLPRNIKSFNCSFSKGFSEIRVSEDRISDIREELQGFEEKKVRIGYSTRSDGGLKKWREVKWDKKLTLLTSPLLPPQLSNKIKPKNKLQENHDIQELNYDEIRFNQWEKVDTTRDAIEEGLNKKIKELEEKLDKSKMTKTSFEENSFEEEDIPDNDEENSEGYETVEENISTEESDNEVNLEEKIEKINEQLKKTKKLPTRFYIVDSFRLSILVYMKSIEKWLKQNK